MKKILLLIVGLFIINSANTQGRIPAGSTITIKAGTNGYVTINGQEYMRGSLGTSYTYVTGDSTLSIYYLPSRTTFIYPTIDTLYQYGDSSNAKAVNMITLRNWFKTNFEYHSY